MRTINSIINLQKLKIMKTQKLQFKTLLIAVGMSTVIHTTTAQDIDFAIKAGMYATQQYNDGLRQIEQIYGSYAAAPIINPDVDKRRNNYIKSISKYIDAFKGLDFRDPRVISTFKELFEPLDRDMEVMNGLKVSETYYNEKSRLNLWKSSEGVIDYDKKRRDYRIYDPEIDKAYDNMALFYSQLRSGDPLLKTFTIEKGMIAIDYNRMINDYFLDFLKALGDRGSGDQVVPLYYYLSNSVSKNSGVIKSKQCQIKAYIWNTYAATGFDEAKTMQTIRRDFVEPMINQFYQLKTKFKQLNSQQNGNTEIVVNIIDEKIKQLKDIQTSFDLVVTREVFLNSIDVWANNIAKISLDYEIMTFALSSGR